MARREWQDPNVLQRESSRGPEWYIRYRVKVLEMVDGKPQIIRREKWQALGLCSDMTKRQAEREKDRILREVNQQVYTLQSQFPFTAFVKIFEQTHLPLLATPTRQNYSQQLRQHITPAFRDMKLSQVGPIEVQRLFLALEKAGVARTTRNTIRGVLSALFRCAKKWRYLQTGNPVEDVDIGGGPRRVRECRIPSLEDVGRLMAECDGDIPLLIETLYVTGMRISEAAGLRVSDVDLGMEAARVCKRYCRGDEGNTKSDRGVRALPLGAVAGAIAAHIAGKRPADFVFTHQNEPIIDNTLLANYLTPRMKKLGIKFPGFGWHTFRRLHLSLMQNRGLSVFELRQQAGHADVRTTQEYIADDLANRAAAVKGLPKVVPIRKAG